MTTRLTLLFAFLYFIIQAPILGQEVMASSLDKVPTGWKGKVFQLSKNYPKSAPKTVDQPWKKFDFKTQPAEYINAIKQYVLEGNIACDWVFEKNKVRKWYHAPSMIWGNNGREFINGLTRERSSRPQELHPNQNGSWQNWAVGFYNEPGGYIIGEVFKDPNNPSVQQIVFPEGTVAAKLLFSNVPDKEAPYMANAFTWDANIHTAQQGSTNRSPAKMRLLQMDIAVKDNRAAGTTDWVMITFAYHNDATGATAWDKLVPVGIQWGNDPNNVSANKPLTETWINPEFKKLFTVGKWSMHTGYKGRLNGPVDNPNSSCLSCHGTAQYPGVSTGMIPNLGNNNSLNKYFSNLNPPTLFEDLPNKKEFSLDYSLQLSVGLPQALARAKPLSAKRGLTGPAPVGSSAPSDTSQLEALTMFLTTRDMEDEENAPATDNTATVEDTLKKEEDLPKPTDPVEPTGGNGLLYWLATAIALLTGGWYWLRKRQPKQ